MNATSEEQIYSSIHLGTIRNNENEPPIYTGLFLVVKGKQTIMTKTKYLLLFSTKTFNTVFTVNFYISRLAITSLVSWKYIIFV